jgi:flagellar motility protein MotE (MotC chaperone)
MKTTLIASLTASLLAATAFTAAAQTPAPGNNTPRADARELRQEQRIEQGIASGTLNARETHRLDQQQQRIDTLENKAKADGKVTLRERAHLEHAQDRASQSIYAQKHDGQVATPAPNPGNNTPRADVREVLQEQRIERGIASGALTAKETHRLDQQQQRIDTMEAKAKADGKVTRGERAHLEHAQDRASRNIYRQKHDKQGAK